MNHEHHRLPLFNKQKKIVLINRELQLKYAWAAIVIGLISTLLTATIILFPLFQFKILKAIHFLPTPFLISMAVAVLLNVLSLAFLAILVTHKIVGPLFALVRQFRLITMGKWNSKLRVRSDDELKFVIRNFNEAIDKVISESESDIEAIETCLKILDGALPEEDVLLIKGNLNELKSRVSGRIAK